MRLGMISGDWASIASRVLQLQCTRSMEATADLHGPPANGGRNVSGAESSGTTEVSVCPVVAVVEAEDSLVFL